MTPLLPPLAFNTTPLLFTYQAAKEIFIPRLCESCACVPNHQTWHLGLASLGRPIILRGQPALASSLTELRGSFLKTAPCYSIIQHIYSVLSSSLRITLRQSTSRQRNRLQGVFPTHPWHFYSSVHSKMLLKFHLPSNSSCLPFSDLPTISSLAK